MGMAQVQSRPSSNWSSSSAKRHDDYYRSSGNFRNPKTETLVQEQTLERGPWVRNSGSDFSSRKSVKSRSCYRNGENTDRARISGWEREPGEISSGGSDRDSPSEAVSSDFCRKRKSLAAGYIRDGSSKRAKFSPIQSEVGRNGSPKKRGDRLSPEREILHEDALHGDGSSKKRAYMPSPGLEVPQEVYSPRGYDPSHGIAGSRWASFESPLHEDETFQAETKRRRVSMEQNTSSSRSMSRSPRVNVSSEGSKRRSASRSLSPEFRGNSVISQAEECEQRDISTNEEDMKRETENSSGSGCAIGEEHQDRPVDDIDCVESTIDEAVGDDESSPVPAGVSRSFDMMRGCRSVDEFQKLNKINEGTYGIVYKARDKKTGEIVALKKVKMEKQREGFPISALREVNILLSINHPSIVNVKEVVVGKDLDSIFMVMEFMEHDLKGFLEKHRKVNKKPLSTSQVKCLLLQLLVGLNHLHENWVLHRDLKTSNLLYNNKGELKICDLGLARQYGSPLRTYTETVVTLWYRAPELLLGAKKYSTAIDMWSVGCIMAELLSSKPLFDAKTEIEQVKKIYKILGKPNEKIWPDFTSLPGSKISFPRERFSYKLRDEFQAPFSGRPPLTESGMDLLSRCLMYDPKKRISCEEALNHPWFKEFPLPEAKEAMPMLPPVNDHCRQPKQYLKSPCFLEAN